MSHAVQPAFVVFNGQRLTVAQYLLASERVLDETGFPPELGYPLTGKEQYPIAMEIVCPFCAAKVGERCKASSVFPQHPHTSRIEVAWLLRQTQQGTQS